MTAVHQNIMSMLKNNKLSNGNVRLHLETPEIDQARSEQNPLMSTSTDLCAHQIFSDRLENFRDYYLYQKKTL